MRYLHTMLRVRNLDAALKFYSDALGLKEVRRVLKPGGRAVLLEPQEGRKATILGLTRALQTPVWAAIAAVWRTMSAFYGRFTPEGLRASLETAGLRVVKIDEALGGLGLLAVAEKQPG